MTRPTVVTFRAGDIGPWTIDRTEPVIGEGLPDARRLEVVQGHAAGSSAARWALKGFTSNERYVERDERAALTMVQERLPQDERRTNLEQRSHHIAVGLEYLPAVARRLHHSRDLGEQFDFLTWFEFPPAASDAFARHPRRTAASFVLALLALTALACGGSSSDRTEVDPLAADTVPLELDACPAEGHADTLGVRGLTPNEIANLPINYTFLHVGPDKCTPARFNPCEPVHYIQNGAAAPSFVVENVREAFKRLSQATGITFVDDGLTDENARRGAYVPERYPGRWAPILVVWEHFPAEQTSGQAQILGNTVPVRVDEITVSARLRFNVDAYNDETTKAPIEDGFGPAANSGTGPIGRSNITWGRIILHELAHVVGLGHTREEGSLMYPDAAQQTIRPTGFSKSDLTGLRYLGRDAGCVTSPPRPTG